MPRLLPLVVALAGLIIVALLLQAGRVHLAANVSAETAPRDDSVAYPAASASTPARAEPERPVRPIQPEIFVPPFGKEMTGLERLPPRAPLTPPKPKEKVEGQLLARPSIDVPGVISFPQGKVTLRGLEPMPVTRVCRDNADRVWHCGMMALTALRRFVRGRSVFCAIDDPQWHGNITARCETGKQDIAAWLASNGWAVGQAATTYAELSKQAEKDREGIFGDDPRGLY